MTLTGLIGYPVAHSLSPRIHTYWAKKYAIETDYKLFTTPPHRVRQVVHRLKNKGAKGFNVTVPHKQAVMEFLDGVDDVARAIGAVNTVIRHNGKFIGTNTDAYGFITNLKQSLPNLASHVKNTVLLGAGGATRAAIVSLKEQGASITLTNRTEKTAAALANEFSIHYVNWESRHSILEQATLLVNTTSLGMKNNPELDLNIQYLNPSAAVHDIVYSPLKTTLLINAEKAGHPTVDGLGMLLYQAQRAFEHWHGVLPEVDDALRTHVLEGL